MEEAGRSTVRDGVETAYRDLPLGRIRSRSVGEFREGVAQVVVVQGMAVADYLMPAVRALAAWTRVHLVELPGFAGSGEPPHRLDVPGWAIAVASWLDATGSDRGVVVAGHSSGTQVAARVAAARPTSVGGLVLASPTVDPVARSWPRLLVRWRLDARREPSDLTESHKPEWRRAGVRGLVHVVRAHLGDPPLEKLVPHLPMPLLVLRGREDRIATAEWAQQLAHAAPRGHFTAMPGPHTFVWIDPEAWSSPIRRLTENIGW